jgi:hypothetical protein
MSNQRQSKVKSQRSKIIQTAWRGFKVRQILMELREEEDVQFYCKEFGEDSQGVKSYLT